MFVLEIPIFLSKLYLKFYYELEYTDRVLHFGSRPSKSNYLKIKLESFHKTIYGEMVIFL